MDILGRTKIYRHENERDGKKQITYSMSLVKKDMEGKYQTAFVPVNFRKGVTIDDKTSINVSKGWLDFYINKDKKTFITAFISEYEVLEQTNNTETKTDVVGNELPF